MEGKSTYYYHRLLTNFHTHLHLHVQDQSSMSRDGTIAALWSPHEELHVS